MRKLRKLVGYGIYAAFWAAYVIVGALMGYAIEGTLRRHDLI